MQTLLNRLKIRTKLYCIVLVAIISIISIQIISLNQHWSELQGNKYRELNSATLLAYSIIEEEHKQVTLGIKTAEKAQSDAKSLISALNYNDGGYLFIVDSKYRILSHPAKPKLINTIQKEFADSNGVKVFKLLVDGSVNNGNTRVEYLWPHTQTGELATKFSVARYYSPWQWVVGTGAYIEELSTLYNDELWLKIEETIIVLILMLLVTYFCAKSIITPIEILKQGMISVSETRNLTLRVKLDSQDELSEMGHAFDEMLDSFESILTELHLSSSQLAATSVELSSTTSQTMIGMEQQTDQTRLVVTAMDQMSSTVTEVANNINEAAIASRDASLATTEGQLIVDESLKSVIDLSGKLQKAEELTQNLEQQSTAISTILEVISDIAEQTNLLALNAAIEAARAGEQGRGFAVVADEVRNLSSRTHQSTNEITVVISSLQEGSLAAASAMKESKEAIDDVEEQSLKVQNALGLITSAVEKIDAMTTQIAGASEEQSKVAEEINGNIVNISEITEQSASSSVQIDSASNELSSLSCRLQEISQRFVLKSHSV